MIVVALRGFDHCPLSVRELLLKRTKGSHRARPTPSVLLTLAG